jgi:hypothetical protein
VAVDNATTVDAIRDRIVKVIEGLAPTKLTTRFREYLSEGDADFVTWCAENPAGALRRFQVLFDGTYALPAISCSDYEERSPVFNIIIAYPQDARAGKKQAPDRHTLIDRDLDQLEQSIGLYGRPNFAAPHPEASFLDWSSRRESGDACDFLIVTLTLRFNRALF